MVLMAYKISILAITIYIAPASILPSDPTIVIYCSFGFLKPTNWTNMKCQTTLTVRL